MTDKVKQDQELLKYLKRIAQQNEVKFMVFRGCVTGIFTALGTLAGLGIIVFVGIRLLPGLSLIPVVDEILRITKLDVLIENQVNQLTGQEEQQQEGDGEENDGNTDGEAQAPTLLSYENSSLGISFEYPSSFDSVNVVDSESGANVKVIELSGEGSLISLQIYANQTTTIVGNSSQRFINRPDNQRITMNVYESGVLVGGEQFTNTVYETSLAGQSSFQFIGISDPQLPKTAREVFVGIIESVSLSE